MSEDLPAPAAPAKDPVLAGVHRALVARPGAAALAPYIGFLGSYALLALVSAPLILRAGAALAVAMTAQVFVQALPTFYSRMGRQEQAARLAAAFARATGGELAEAHRLDAADFWLRHGDVEASKQALTAVEPEGLPRDRRLRWFQVQAALLMQTGDPATALVMSEAALALTEDASLAPRPELLTHRALALYGLGRSAEALACLAEVDEADLDPRRREFLGVLRGVLAEDPAGEIPAAPGVGSAGS